MLDFINYDQLAQSSCLMKLMPISIQILKENIYIY